MVRQSIAISFSILAFSKLNENNNKSFFLCTLIAYLFHGSSIIMIPLYILYKIFDSKKIDVKLKTTIKFVIIILSIITVIYLPEILSFLYKIGLFPDIKYNIYTVKYARNKLDFSIINTTLYILIYLFLKTNKTKIETRIKNYDFWIFFYGKKHS